MTLQCRKKQKKPKKPEKNRLRVPNRRRDFFSPDRKSRVQNEKLLFDGYAELTIDN